jgi:hypothetical protein
MKSDRAKDGVYLDPAMRGKGRHDPAGTPGDPLNAVVRGAAGLAIGGAKAAGAVTQELLRRLPRPQR